MDVDPPQPLAHQLMDIDEPQDVLARHGWQPWKLGQQGEDLCPSSQTTARQFADHKRVAEHLPVEEQNSEPGVVCPKVVNPD